MSNQKILARAEQLDKTILSKFLSWQEIVTLAEYGRTISAAKGTEIFKEGETADCMYFLIKGKLNVFKHDSMNICKLITRISPGKTVGEMALIDGQLRSATISCAHNSELVKVSKEQFDTLMERSPKLANKLLMYISKLIVSRLRSTSGALVDFLD